jgi:formylglycine-generating enzyme required for sulfatase activity
MITKLFVSYSRQDLASVDRLVRALSAHDELQIFQDTKDILPTEEWKKRLQNLIATADTIVFCVSPNSAASEVCAWEVEVAESLNKRIAPFVIAKVDGQVPSGLSKLNYIWATEAHDFNSAVSSLLLGLNTDIAWIREHTRLSELARRWAHNSRPRDELLRGVSIDAAEQWAKYRPTTAPALTGDTLSYIAESKISAADNARMRRRTRNALAALTIALVGIIGLAYASFLDAPYIAGQMNGVRNRWQDSYLKPGDVKRDCWSQACPEMVLLPTGNYLIGSPSDENGRRDDEGPRHKVTIKDKILVGKYEVTFDEWDLCYRSGGCSFLPKDQSWGRGRRPVINVTWNDLQQYLTWLSIKTGMSYRLLNENEWEFASRGIVDAGMPHPPYSWGDVVGRGNAHCKGCNEGELIEQTLPVGSFKANGFGLHDMLGNVWEWVHDCYIDKYQAGPPATPNCLRVARGGSWINGPAIIRAAYRNRFQPGAPYSNIGFRVARSITR